MSTPRRVARRRPTDERSSSAPPVASPVDGRRNTQIRIAEHPNSPLSDDVVQRLERAAAEVAGSTVEARETDRAWTASLI